MNMGLKMKYLVYLIIYSFIIKHCHGKINPASIMQFPVKDFSFLMNEAIVKHIDIKLRTCIDIPETYPFTNEFLLSLEMYTSNY